jgi:flagellin
LTPGILTINEVNIAIQVFEDPATARTALLNAIGGASGLGDIQASFDADDNFLLTSPSGADIRLLVSANSDYFDGGDYTTTTTFSGGIEISSILDSLTVSGTGAATLGLDGPAATQTFSMDEVSVANRVQANNALVAMDGAIDMVTAMRANLGAIQNRFENVIEVAGVQNENLSAARSRIQDADFAAETANLTRAQILQQAGLASLAQANASPQAVLRLLG